LRTTALRNSSNSNMPTPKKMMNIHTLALVPCVIAAAHAIQASFRIIMAAICACGFIHQATWLKASFQSAITRNQRNPQPEK
jgi:hypothetical protein